MSCVTSRVTCHVSRVTCHVSRVTCHVSHVTIFFFILFIFFLRTKWWSLLVEGLLSMGPTPSSFLIANTFCGLFGKLSGQGKTFWVAMLPCYQSFSLSGAQLWCAKLYCFFLHWTILILSVYALVLYIKDKIWKFGILKSFNMLLIFLLIVLLQYHVVFSFKKLHPPATLLNDPHHVHILETPPSSPPAMFLPPFRKSPLSM